MNNPYVTPKERNLIKGALRRVFSRSELRRQVVQLTVVKHEDSKRPRVKTWCKCPQCLEFIPRSYMVVDHIQPIIGTKESLENLSWDTVINRLWCNNNNLIALCNDCHDKKTKRENEERRKFKKENKK